MAKANYSQLELFSGSKNPPSVNTGLSNSFLKYIWNYEKIILLFIGFIITGVISFSLGVERGKRFAFLNEGVRAAKIHQPAAARDAGFKKNQQDAPLIKNEAVINTQNYTIQVASYKTKALAQKEAQTLKKKGYTPSLLAKNGYIILCVGNFSNKETARTLLSQLKKYYRDCLIRRL